MYATTETFVGKVLSNKAFVKIGLISYSAYLWHQPIFAFSRYHGQQNLNTGIMGLLILLTIILAWLSWKFIETPFKNKMRFERPLIFKLSISISIFFILFGYGFSKVFNNYGTDEKSAFLLTQKSAIYFTGISNEAVFKESLINAQKENPDILVIGSSRIMQVRSPDQRKLLNLGISGSALRDNMGMIYLAEKKLDPKIIIIEVAPWLYSSQVADGRYKTLENAYYSLIGKPQEETTHVTWKSRFKKSIHRFYDHTTYSFQTPKDDSPELKTKVRSDGSHVYDTAYASLSQKKMADGFNDLLKYKATENYNDHNEYVSREASKIEFISFIKQQQKNREIVLILSPYHPKLYARMEKELPQILNIEKDIKEIATKNKIKIIGSHNPSLYKCNEVDFYDGMHPKESCMRNIVNEIKTNF